MFKSEKLNKLNCMNYIVEDSESHYYIQCGIRSLYKFAKRTNSNFKLMCRDLLNKGYFVASDNDTQISMI